MTATRRPLEAGDRLPEQQRSSDVVQSVMIAGATWNFHRIHWDGDYARSEGLPDAIANSAQLMAWLEALVDEVYGGDAVWHGFEVRFRSPVPLGAVVHCGGEVQQAIAQPNGTTLLTLGLWVGSGPTGEPRHLDGRATIEVPR